MNFGYWSQPVGIVTGLLMAAGVVSAILTLFNLVGKNHQAKGTIETLEYYQEMRILETTILLDDRWQGHQSGQFVFATFDHGEGAHPFTIASAWDGNDRRIVFITKALGDYTALLPDRLKVGGTVKVEGPYGGFTFNDGHKRQIWIGGGIGITPFIARMKQLAQSPDNQVIDLFHSTTELAPSARKKLDADVTASKVRLHLLIDGQDGLLNGARLRDAIPDWKSASVWFCGPSGFGKALRDDLVAHGLSPEDFHQELFNMR